MRLTLHLALCFSLVGADKLDEALASAIFPASSTLCQGGGASTSFSTTYTSTAEVSDWDVNTAAYEEDVFEVDMSHSDSNQDRAWTIRLGKGGQIASFRVAAGEAIANQASTTAIWNDLVQQMVAVNTALNTPTHPNFIHQAGPYAKDTGMPPPFYSPNVALDCSAGNDCSTINWGQQAHVPTPHDSPLLYYTRYRDCGDGIIEYDMAMHHFGQDTSDMYSFFNTPWTGVRTSTFRDMMIANPAGELEHAFPMTGFGPSLRDLETTGGFTTFAEDLELASDVFDFGFCVDTTKVLPETANTGCVDDNPDIVPFRFTVQANGTASETGHSAWLGLDYTVRMNLCNLTAPVKLGVNGWGNPYDGVLLTNDRTGFAFESDYIIHYCWQDNHSYMGSSVSAAVLNQEFIEGDTISVKYITSGQPLDSQRALTFVHGQGAEYDSTLPWYRAKSRLRYGLTNNRRDGTVWTTNFLGKLYPTETYFSRKYMITDSLINTEVAASPLVDETFEDVAKIEELELGEAITLWMDDTSFGASIGAEACSVSNAAVGCSGSSTPKSGSQPWFLVTCGSNTATTTDPYYFAVLVGDMKKPYLCVDETESLVRAKWKLLGFFDSGCAAIGGREYQSDFCLESSAPSVIASNAPSATSSDSPSVTESSAPSVSASNAPSDISSDSPSVTESSSPSVRASNAPSMTSSSSPSVTESSAPTVSASNAPSATSSSSPSVTESSAPSVKASNAPSATSSGSPSVTESSAPTVSASNAPSATSSSSPSVTESSAPSVKASNKPSETSSDSPSVTESSAPSVSASVAPSDTSSDSPSNAPVGGTCEDSQDWIYVRGRKVYTCDWVAKKPKSRCQTVGQDGTLALDSCLDTCSNCP